MTMFKDHELNHRSESKEGAADWSEAGTPPRKVSNTLCRLNDTKSRPLPIEALKQERSTLTYLGIRRWVGFPKMSPRSSN